MAYLSREDVIVFIIFATIGLCIPTVVVLHHFIGIDPLSTLNLKWGRPVIGIVFTLFAAVVCLSNFYLSLLVPWLHNRRHGSMADFRGVSGLPVIGSLFICFAGVLMPPSVPLGISLLLLYFIDGNGFPWIFISFIQTGV